MSAKWKTPIKCPDCASTAVRRREVVHKSGTSIYSGRSSTSGLSFGLSGKARPRVWFGGGSNSGKRQNIKAKEAEPLPFWPSIIIPILVFLFRNEGESFGVWSWIWFAFSGLWLVAAIGDRSRYREEWVCSKCGAVFIPELADIHKQKQITKVNQMEEINISAFNEDDGSIDPKDVVVDPNDDRYTIPKTWGVYRLAQLDADSTTSIIRYGNHPIRQRELEREFGTVELMALYTVRELAMQRANSEQ